MTPTCPGCALKMIDWFQSQPAESAVVAAELDRLRTVVTAALAVQARERAAQEGS